jgi:hypothetical protein
LGKRLSILQDSKSDWEDESFTMGMIYSNSVVTIAADWPADANSKCFNQSSDNVSADEDGLIRITSILSDGRRSSLYLGMHYKKKMLEIQNSLLTTCCVFSGLLSPLWMFRQW